MANVPGTPNALTLASAVVGQGSDDQIAALVASGDKLRGELVLQIAVTVPASGLQPGSHTIRCYRYVFRNSINDAKPHHISCPSLAPLVVPSVALTPSPAS